MATVNFFIVASVCAVIFQANLVYGVEPPTECVSCEGDENSECAKDKPDKNITAEIKSCATYLSLQQCISYKNFDVESEKTITYRGCANVTSQCDVINKNDNSIKACQTCFEKDCVPQFSTEYTLCVQCSGDECANDAVRVDSKTKFAKFDSKSTQQCIAYKYLDVTDYYGQRVIYYRGVTDDTENNCTILNEKSVTKSCNQCKDSDNCNKNFDNATQYRLCVNCSGDECPDQKVGIDAKTEFCKIDSSSTRQCVAYEYLDVADSKVKYYRGCADDSENVCQIQNEKSATKSCIQCKNFDNCNRNFDTATQYKLCINCTGDECQKDLVTINGSTKFVKVETKSTQQCIIYKYLDVLDGKVKYYRGVTDDRGNNCTIQNQISVTKSCNECTDGDICNKNFKTASQYTLCVNCAGDECPGDEVAINGNTKFCKIMEYSPYFNQQCLAYKYLDENNKTITERTCGNVDSCSEFYTQKYKDKLIMCNKCKLDNCNTNVDTIYTHSTCVKCEDETDCAADEVDTTKVTGNCTLDDTVNTECVAYKYLNNDNTTITARGCAPTNYCATLQNATYKDALLMCNECTGNQCNVKTDMGKLNKTCIQCEGKNGTDCAAKEVDTTKVEGRCSLDDTVNTTCLAYTYFKVDEDKPVEYIYRGCGSTKDYDTQKALPYTKVIIGCNDTDLCNSNFGEEQESTICITCSGDDCKDDILILKDNTQFCKLDGTTTTVCIAYKYQDGDKTNTTRSCAEENKCSTLTKDNLSMCNQCTKDNCNINVDTNTPHSTCVKCEDDTDCAADEVDTTKVTDNCTLDDTVNTECVAYRYLNKNNATVTARGCAPTNNCNTLYTNTHKDTLQMCNECTEDRCNVNIDMDKLHKKCIQCEDKDGSDCAALVVNPSKVNSTCRLDDTVNTQCLAYKYFKVEDGKPVEYTYRGCGSREDYRAQKALPYTKVIIRCYEEDLCNSDFIGAQVSTICIACSGNDCKDDTLTLTDNNKFCKLDGTTNKTCLAYRYQDGNGATITTRSCDKEDSCSTLSTQTYKDKLLMCNKCSGDNCNIDVDTDPPHPTCVKCEDGENCAADEIDTTKVKDTCSLDDTVNKQCITYKYINGENTLTYRGCAPTDECSNKNDKENTKLCNECSNENCNAKTDTTAEKTLCIKCEDEECNKDDVVPTKDSQYCALEADHSCIVYKYSEKNSNSETPVYYRGCVEKTKGCTYLNSTEKFKTDPMQDCYECEDIDLCNRKINTPSTDKPATPTDRAPTTQTPEVTTAGAPSIVSFGIFLLPMVIGTLLACIV